MPRLRLSPEDVKLAEALAASEGLSTRGLSQLVGLERVYVSSRLRTLRRLGLVSPKPGARGVYALTDKGRLLAERRDIHVFEPYSPGSTVPAEKAFKFAIGEGLYTGDLANSYEEFTQLLGRIDARCLTFHLYRRDFENWVREVFDDRQRARRIRRLASTQLPAEQIRTRLARIFSTGLVA